MLTARCPSRRSLFFGVPSSPTRRLGMSVRHVLAGTSVRLRCRKAESNTRQLQPDIIRPIRDQMRGIWSERRGRRWLAGAGAGCRPRAEPELGGEKETSDIYSSVMLFFCTRITFVWFAGTGQSSWFTLFCMLCDSRGHRRDQSEKGQGGVCQGEGAGADNRSYTVLHQARWGRCVNPILL